MTQKRHYTTASFEGVEEANLPYLSFVKMVLQGETNSENDERTIEQQKNEQIPLCDLQTLLRLAGCLDTGGATKVAIQEGSCNLNGVVETRRAKKLFPGDVVTFGGVNYNVENVVQDKNYIFKPKQKKVKPPAKVDEYGNKEFGGRFRSEEWRAERKQKKANRKSKNAGTTTKNNTED